MCEPGERLEEMVTRMWSSGICDMASRRDAARTTWEAVLYVKRGGRRGALQRC
jgi:hypothetical protein